VRNRGFTMLEALLGGVIFALVFASVTAAVISDSQTQQVLIASLGPEQRARHAFERMVSELRMATIWGEDLNQNGFLDPGEDVNGNGVLDRAWDLPLDTGEVRSSLAFNVRTDTYDSTGAVKESGLVSPRLSYRMIGDQLVRESMVLDGEGKELLVRDEVASGIAALHFQLKGRLLTVQMDVRIRNRQFASPIRTLAASVWLVN